MNVRGRTIGDAGYSEITIPDGSAVVRLSELTVVRLPVYDFRPAGTEGEGEGEELPENVARLLDLHQHTMVQIAAFVESILVDPYDVPKNVETSVREFMGNARYNQMVRLYASAKLALENDPW